VFRELLAERRERGKKRRRNLEKRVAHEPRRRPARMEGALSKRRGTGKGPEVGQSGTESRRKKDFKGAAARYRNATGDCACFLGGAKRSSCGRKTRQEKELHRQGPKNTMKYSGGPAHFHKEILKKQEVERTIN